MSTIKHQSIVWWIILFFFSTAENSVDLEVTNNYLEVEKLNI